MHRKEFLQIAAATLGAGYLRTVTARRAAANSTEHDGDNAIPRRRLGRTALYPTILAFGTSRLHHQGSEREACQVIETALSEGIRCFDTAEVYGSGSSEKWLGNVLGSFRSQVIIMSKTFTPQDRTANSAQRHLDKSLVRLRTDYLDVWQVHALASPHDTDAAFAPRGAMSYLQAMRERGVVRAIGVTSHLSPAALLRAIEYWDRGIRFDVMQLPINPTDGVARQLDDSVLPMALSRGIGIVATATDVADWLRARGVCEMSDCLEYALSFPIGTAVMEMSNEQMTRDLARRAQGLENVTARTSRGLMRCRPCGNPGLEFYYGA